MTDRRTASIRATSTPAIMAVDETIFGGGGGGGIGIGREERMKILL